MLLNYDINCVFDGISQKGSIFISNVSTSQNRPILQRNNINSILSITKNSSSRYNQFVKEHLVIPIDDLPTTNIKQFFQETYEFIEKGRKMGNVLVHCVAGVSRSATIVIAYLIKKYGYELETVYSMIKRRRNQINPNSGFMEQLKQYQKIIAPSNCRKKSYSPKTSQSIKIKSLFSDCLSPKKTKFPQNLHESSVLETKLKKDNQSSKPEINLNRDPLKKQIMSERRNCIANCQEDRKKSRLSIKRYHQYRLEKKFLR